MDAPGDLTALPDGLTARSMTLADVDIVTELVAACELHHDGVIEIDREDIEVDWARPGYDLATESIGVFDGDRLVAEAEVFKGKRAEINVHPDELGRGIGTALLGWTEDLAARQGSTRVSQTTTDANTAAAAILEAPWIRLRPHVLDPGDRARRAAGRPGPARRDRVPRLRARTRRPRDLPGDRGRLQRMAEP